MTNQTTAYSSNTAMLVSLRRLQSLASLIIILTGGLVLIDRALQLEWIANDASTIYSMKANTAFTFIVAGLALGLQQANATPTRRRLTQLAAGVVMLISLLTLAEYLFGWNLGIDELLLPAQPAVPGTPFPGRMGFNTAVCLLLAGCALLLLEVDHAWGRPAEWLTLAAGFVTLMALIGHIYGVDELIGPFNFTTMAFPTIFAFGVLCWGILMARPQQGIMAHFWSNGPQGIVARRMTFGGIISLLLLSCLTEWGERQGLYGRDHESSLLLSLGIVVFSLLVYQSIGALARLEQQRQASLTELQAQYALLQGIINNTHDGIYVRDLQGRYLLVNQTGAALAGSTPSAMLGKTYHELFSTPVAAGIATEDRAVISSGSVQVQELESIGNEQPLILHSVKTPYRDLAGTVIGVLNVVRDITDRKQAEERLRAAQKEQAELLALLEALLDNAPIGFAFFDRELRFVRVNEKLAELNHLPIAAHLGQPLATILPALAPALGAFIEEVFTTGQGVYHQPFSSANAATPADVRHVLASWYPVTVDAAGVRFVGAAIVDVTALRRAEAELRDLNNTLGQRVAERTAELERSNRELDQFAYVASHDLKAPLRAIVNLANWITEDAGALLPPPSQEHLNKLGGRALRMERLLDDLLEYSRIGRRDGAVERVEVAGLLQDTVDLLAPPPGFKLILGSELPTLYTLRTPLALVFRNLIGNAIKHHHQPAKGTVSISAKSEADSLITFCVSDNGPGIEPQYHERIFGLFQTLHPRDEVEGSGIGLAIVKKAVEARGGTIQVKSTLGNGTTFYFTWPKQIK